MDATTRETGIAMRRAETPPGGKRYRVKAVWRTLQGEGAFAGRPAVFVRFAGCNMWSGYEADRARDAARHEAHCPLWCDTDFKREGSIWLSAADLVDEMQALGGPVRFAVLTGGEPLLHISNELVQGLHAAGFQVAVETNGSVPLAKACGPDPAGWPDWIVCSPKWPAEKLRLEVCDELKLVVPDYQPQAYASMVERVRAREVGGRMLRYLWLQPEDGPRTADAVRQAIAWAQADPEWRVSVQTHKLLGID